MPILDLPGLPVHYQEAGSGAEVFVLLHGNFASSRWWKLVLDRLPPGFRAVAPDLRGCGETPAGEGAEDRSAFGIPRLAGDLHAFAGALGLESFHLAGHSLGGAVALQYALEHRQRVRSLTLAAPPPPSGLASMREGTSRSARLLRLVDPDHAPSMAALRSGYRVQRSLGANRWVLRRALGEMMPAAALEPALAESLLSDAARMSPEAVVGMLQALHRWNVAAGLPTLHLPAVIVWGERDPLVPRAGLEEMARLLPSAELLVWPDTGHSPQLERPDEFTALLASSARGLAGRRLGMMLRRAKRWCAAAFGA